MKSEVEARADFSIVRYAQCWEDADVLLPALNIKPGGTYLSIASAGDNALSMLAGNPKKVIAADLNPAQTACAELRKAAYRRLGYEEMLAFTGIRPGGERDSTYDYLRIYLPETARRYWDRHRVELLTGFYHTGRFEHYFSLFRKLMRTVHTQKEIAGLFVPKSKEERTDYYDRVWNNRRWNMVFHVFFSEFVMGRLGRDPAFFKYVEVPVSERILERARYAMTELDPSENPYLYYILNGNFGEKLPFALRRENYEAIRRNLDALEIRCCSVEDVLNETAEPCFDGFNLSDIFEYMSEDSMEQIYGRLLSSSAPGARIVYWNMLAPRSVPDGFAGRVHVMEEEEDHLFAQDKAFFYSAFHIEEVK